MDDDRESLRWVPRVLNEINGVVEHIGFTDSYDDLVDYLLTNAYESATFVIGRDPGQWGLITGSGPNILYPGNKLPADQETLTRGARHILSQTADSRNPYPALDPNRWTIAKQHVGYPGDLWTDAEIANDRECNQYILSLVGRKAFRHILAHSDFDSGIDCPGPGFPWAWLYHKARFVETEELQMMQAIPRENLELLNVGDYVGWRRLYQQRLRTPQDTLVAV